MSYLRRWRQNRSAAEALAIESSSGEELYMEHSDHSDNVSGPNGQNSTPVSRSSTPSLPSGNDSGSDYGFCEYVVASSSESDNENIDNAGDEENQQSLREQVASWATQNKCTRAGINEILGIFRNSGHADALPKDARTLLQTPREVPSEDKCGGKYVYIGIKNGVDKVLSRSPSFVTNGTDINLFVNIDGIPLFKSSGTQFWPIICSFGNLGPFLVSLYYGESKPTSVDEFLQDFLLEYNGIQRHGIVYEDKQFRVTLKAFVCDAPARAFLKCVKGHGGYNACERCSIHGTYMNHRVTFYGDDFPLRSDDEFSAGIYAGHQIGVSPLCAAGIKCVTGFVLDYMHLVCLGVMKRVLCFFKQGPPVCKLSHRHILEISSALLSLAGKLPSEFARQPRSMSELDRWKATEFRQFLLYTGPIVLRKVLPRAQYDHFLSLTVAISILLDSSDTKREAYLTYATDLLKYFVSESKDIYTECFIVYNVHALAHLADDCKNFKCSLNELSAFPFENHLQVIKKLVRNAKNPLAQVVKRTAELEIAGVQEEKLEKQFSISTSTKNGCLLLDTEDFAFVKEKRDDGKFVCDVVKQIHTDSFFQTPCNSKLLNIVQIKDRDRITKRRRVVSRKEINRKVVLLPYGRGYVLFPLLHGMERRQ